MARGQVDQLDTPAVEEGVATDEEGVRSLAHQSHEGRIYLAAATGVEDLDLQAHGARSQFHVSYRILGIRCITRIDEHCHTSSSGYQLPQQFQSLRRQLCIEEIDPCQVAARSGEAGDKAKPTGSPPTAKMMGIVVVAALTANAHWQLQVAITATRLRTRFSRECWQSIVLILGPTVFDRDVLALDIAGFSQALAKSTKTLPVSRQAIWR